MATNRELLQRLMDTRETLNSSITDLENQIAETTERPEEILKSDTEESKQLLEKSGSEEENSAVTLLESVDQEIHNPQTADENPVENRIAEPEPDQESPQTMAVIPVEVPPPPTATKPKTYSRRVVDDIRKMIAG